MADLLIFIIPCAAVSVLAYVMGAAMGYIEGRRRAITDGDGTDLRRFIPALAKRLDIEADAGEAEDFVRWAVDEALEEVRNG